MNGCRRKVPASHGADIMANGRARVKHDRLARPCVGAVYCLPARTVRMDRIAAAKECALRRNSARHREMKATRGAGASFTGEDVMPQTHMVRYGLVVTGIALVLALVACSSPTP